MYYKSQVQWTTFGNITWAYPATQIFKGVLEGLMRDCQLMLTPLNKITLEHAIQVAKLYGMWVDEETIAIRIKPVYDAPDVNFAQLYQVNRNNEESILMNFDISPVPYLGNHYYGNQGMVRQFLIDNHYLVPLYFEPGNVLNHLTAADLRVSVDLTQI